MKVNYKVEIIKCIECDDGYNIYIIKENKRLYKYIVFDTVLEELTNPNMTYTFTPFYKCNKFYKQLLKEFLSENYNQDRVDYYPNNMVKIDYHDTGRLQYTKGYTKGWYGAVRTKLSKAKLCKILMDN